MEEKTKIMVSLATAVGVNCIPCFDHIYEKARNAGIDDDVIMEIVETATKVKNGAAVFLKNAVNELMDRPVEDEKPCCVSASGGCC